MHAQPAKRIICVGCDAPGMSLPLSVRLIRSPALLKTETRLSPLARAIAVVVAASLKVMVVTAPAASVELTRRPRPS